MRIYKILHIIGGGEIGGAEQHVLTLLKGLQREQFTPRLACLINGPFADLALKHKISTRTFPMHHPLDLSPLPALLRWARQEKIDLIHTHGSRANLLGRLGAKYLKIPCLSTVHSSLAHDYCSPWSARFALCLDRLTLPLTSGIITVSEYLAQEVASRGGKKPVTIYNGYPPLSFGDQQAKSQSFRRQWDIPENAFVLGTIGRLHPTKGQTHLIKAAALLRPQYPNLHLLLIGEGPLREHLESELKLTTIPYTLTGYLPDAYKALSAMDIFILPSLSEGMGLVLLEALQAKVPIVASAVGGIPEVIRNGKDGLLVPPANAQELAQACASLIEDEDLAKSLVLSGQSRWTKFSIATMITETENFYKRLLTSAQPLNRKSEKS